MHIQINGLNGRGLNKMQENYLLTDLGIVSALGVGVEETKKRLFLGDSSGMKELTSLVSPPHILQHNLPYLPTRQYTPHERHQHQARGPR